MEQAEALPWTELLNLDVYTLLHSAGLHEEADHVSQELQAAFAERGLPNKNTSSCISNRLGHLRRQAEAYNLCFGLIQNTCSSHLESGIAPLQQKLWCRSLDVSRDLLLLHDQQQKQLESWSSRYKGLRQEHQVLRSNLRSLKLTVQQLLTDVSTLLQHTASARQQQQQQEALQQQQDAGLSTGWSKHADFQQHLQRTGFALPKGTSAVTGIGAATAAAGASHRGSSGGRRCVSADGSAPKSDGAAGANSDSHASLVAMTMQRLICSIERMSRHFADCQAGKLIEDYGSGLANQAAPGAAPTTAAATGGQPVGDAAAMATNAKAEAGSDPTADGAANAASAAPVSSSTGSASASLHSRCNSSRGTSNGTADGKLTALSQVTELDIITGSGRPGSSNGSSTASSSKLRVAGTAVRAIPRPPSSSGGSSGRPGLRTSTAPVLSGVAAAAAAISSAMASAAVPKAVSTRPGAQRTLAPGAKPLPQGCLGQEAQTMQVSTAGGGEGVCSQARQQPQGQPLKQRQELVQAKGLQGVKTDDAMRHSFDTKQAKAAADAWFAQKARGSASILDSAADSAAAAAAGASRVYCVPASAAAAGGGGVDNVNDSSKETPDATPEQQGLQHQGQAADLPGQALGVDTDTGAAPGAGTEAEATNLARELSSGSSNMSSLGPSISEVWQAANAEHSGATMPAAAAPAGTADGVAAAGTGQSAAAAVSKQLQQQAGHGQASTAGTLPPQGLSTGRPGRQPSAAAVTGAAGVSRIGSGINRGGSGASTAAAGPGARLPVRSSGGSASNGSSVWGSGCSIHTKQASRPTRPSTGRPVVLPSGPLTAALHSSAARRQANSANSAHSSSSACFSSSAARDSTGSLTKGSPVRCVSANGQHNGQGRPSRGLGYPPTCDGSSNSWGGAGTNSRSGSSCSYRSRGSSGYSSSGTGSSCAQAGAGQTAMHGFGAHEGALHGAYAAGSRVERVTTGPGSNTSSPASDGVLFGSGSSSAANSPAGKGAPCQHSSPAGVWGQLPAAAAEAAAGLAGAPKAVRSIDWSGPVQGSQHMSADTALGAAVNNAGQAAQLVQQQQQGRQFVAAGQLPPPPPSGHQPHAAVQLMQQPQLAVQPVPPCVLASRVQTGLLSPIIEEASCHTTPRTSASDPTEGGKHLSRGACSSSGTCRGASKLSDGSCAGVRLCISDDGTPNNGSCMQASSKQPAGAQQALHRSVSGTVPGQHAATLGMLQQQVQGVAKGDARAADAPDAFKDAGRGGSPKQVRTGSISPPDTAVGKDTAPPAGSNSSSAWRKQGAAQQEKQQWQQQCEQGQHGGLLGRTADELQEIQPEEIQVSYDIMQGAPVMVPQGGNVSNPQSLAAFPLDMGLVSHSLDSLDTVLVDTTSCQSDEDNCANLAADMARTLKVRRLENTEGSSATVLTALPAAGGGVNSVDGCARVGDAVLCGPVRAAGCMLDLQDLLAIVLDVMNDKQAADKRYMASGLAQPTLGRHLQCYVAAKVHSNQAAYSSAMSAILTGLEQHKQVQPEIAVFCRVLSDELDEDYFHHRHLRLRQQLQHLATQAALCSTQPQEQQQQPVSDLWEDCCSMPLDEAPLQGMLRLWAVERFKMLQLMQGQQLDVLGLTANWELDIRQHCGCGPGEAVRAGSAVAALLLWELDQQLQHLKPIADAFRTADVSCQGVLGLENFKVFCRRLNQAMSDEEIQVLFYHEMRAQQHEQVTFSAICRALLPAM